MADIQTSENSQEVDPGQRVSESMKLRLEQLKWVLFSFKGRLNRLQFLGCVLLVYGVPLGSYFLITSLPESGLLTISRPVSAAFAEPSGIGGTIALIIAVPLFFWITWAVGVKRAHDFGKTWLMLVGLGVLSNIPYIGLIFALVPFLWKGDETSNEFGTGAGWDNRPI